MGNDETPAPAIGQVWNWQDCGQWRETTLTERHEHAVDGWGGWSGRGLDGDVGFFPDYRWRNGEFTFVRTSP